MKIKEVIRCLDGEGVGDIDIHKHESSDYVLVSFGMGDVQLKITFPEGTEACVDDIAFTDSDGEEWEFLEFDSE